MSLREVFLLLWRGLLLRCPRCGRGKLFRRGYAMHPACAVCGWVFEREEGYWTGAMAVNLLAAELVVILAVVPVCVWVLMNDIPMVPVIVVGMLGTMVLPLLFFRHSKSLWMSIDFMLHPVPLWRAPRQSPKKA